MTEEQAKTKWCFHHIASHTNPRHRAWAEGDEQLPEPTGPFTYHCIASACMAWRVMGRIEIRHKYTGAVIPPDAWRVRGDYEETKVADGGYCGLAGQPS